jgi:hypothetical protein
MKQLSCIFLAIFLFAGCATLGIPTRAPVQNSFEIEKPFDATWEAVLAVLAERSLNINLVKKDSGLIMTDFISFEEGFFTDHKIKSIAIRPSVFSGEWSKAKYSVGVIVQPIDETKTKIKITPHIQAYESAATRKWYDCDSIGKIEKEIYDSVAAKLK